MSRATGLSNEFPGTGVCQSTYSKCQLINNHWATLLISLKSFQNKHIRVIGLFSVPIKTDRKLCKNIEFNTYEN